jgi:hypothetical protein
VIVAFALLIPARAAYAQTDTQVWAELSFTRIKSRSLTYGFDLEPKVLVSKPDGDPAWATLDVTPSVEYTRGLWLDVVGEMLVGRTRQTDDLDSTEITPRIGLRLHLLSNLNEELAKEKHPKRRLVLRDLLRLEWRNLYYSTDKPDSSSLRLRNRIEMQFPITRERMTDDGATYVLSDAEWFWPVDQPDERFASKQRLRVGMGYRRDVTWRFEVIYDMDRSRNTIEDGFKTTDYIVDFRVKRVW